MNGTQVLSLALKIVECSDVQQKMHLFNSCDERYRGLLAENVRVINQQKAYQKQLAAKRKQVKLNRKAQVKVIPNSARTLRFDSSSARVSSHYIAQLRKQLAGEPNV